MKQKIKIIQDNQTVYQGRIADMPIKHDFIIQKSIELFGDDDPCIIHQSYVIKEYVDVLLQLFKQHNTTELVLRNISATLSFLDLDSIEDCIIILEG